MLKTNKQFIIIVFLFTFPLLASVLLFHYHDYFHLKTLNRGTLITSPMDVRYLYTRAKNAEQKKWRIVYVADENCNHQCEEIHHQLQQVQKALGKDSDRVKTMLINDHSVLQQLKTSLIQQKNKNFVVNNKIYLVDPLGNLFMYYPSDVNPMDVLNDLKRVLEVSQIG